MLTFTITDEEEQKVAVWLKEVYTKAIEEQKQKILPSHEFYDIYKTTWDIGYPYTGTIGGGLTYSFTPTGLGVIVTVKEAITGEELNLTDFDSW